MFSLIVALLIALDYFFMAPKTVRNTLNAIGVVGLVALLLVLAVMSFIKILQLPGELYIGLIMIPLGYTAFSWHLSRTGPFHAQSPGMSCHTRRL